MPILDRGKVNYFVVGGVVGGPVGMAVGGTIGGVTAWKMSKGNKNINFLY